MKPELEKTFIGLLLHPSDSLILMFTASHSAELTPVEIGLLISFADTLSDPELSRPKRNELIEHHVTDIIANSRRLEAERKLAEITS